MIWKEETEDEENRLPTPEYHSVCRQIRIYPSLSLSFDAVWQLFCRVWWLLITDSENARLSKSRLLNIFSKPFIHPAQHVLHPNITPGFIDRPPKDLDAALSKLFINRSHQKNFKHMREVKTHQGTTGLCGNCKYALVRHCYNKCTNEPS